MEKFFILKGGFINRHVFIDEYTAPEPYDRDYDGLPISKAEEPARLYYKYKTHRKTDYIAGIHCFPVISQRLQKILLELNISHLECHPVELICKKTEEVDASYSFLNILNNVQCFDWEQSEFETVPQAPQVVIGVGKLVVKQDTIQGRDLVRMDEIRSLILVSARLKYQIETAKLTGIEFVQLKDYRKMWYK